MRDHYEDGQDDVVATGTRNQERSSWSGRPVLSKVKLVPVAGFGISVLLYLWLIFFSERVSTSYVSPVLLDAKNILWLTAHPDDESMFFAPSIFNLLALHASSQGVWFQPTGHILSLSAGNNDGLGSQRTVEMRAACLGLGVETDKCITLDQERLQDSPEAWWPEDAVEYWTRNYIEKWNIDTIITFDEEGISGHANHRALNAALTKAVNIDLQFPAVFTLRTTRSVFSKYSSLFLYPYVRLCHRWRINHPLPKIEWDPLLYPIGKQKHEFLPKQPEFTPSQLRTGYSHPFSSHPTLLINSPWQYLKSRTAFKQHKTQVVWFRRLYMFTSRYMWFNELERIIGVHQRVVDLGKIRQAQKDSL